MALNRTLNMNFGSGDQRIGGSVSLSASGACSISEAVPASSSRTLDVEIDVSALKSIFLVSDARTSFEFSGPDNAFQLLAGVPFAWWAGSGIPNPFGSTDVESVLVENEEAVEANVKLELLYDATP